MHIHMMVCFALLCRDMGGNHEALPLIEKAAALVATFSGAG